MTKTTLKTRNAGYGFFSTVQSNYGLSEADQAAAWDAAMETLQEVHGATAEDARNFLDSRYGRHFADALSFFRDSETRPVPEMLKAYASGETRKSDRKWVAKELAKMATAAIREEFDADAKERGEE